MSPPRTMQVKQCANCGTELSPDLPRGLCPACLLEAGMMQNTADGEAGADEAATTSEQLPRPMRGFGEYDLLNEIARGGQGVVYRARHTTLNREVALKMLPLTPWATDAHLQRFRIEARATAELDHPGIVPIYDIGEFEGQHYFTMKLIDGTGLNRLAADQLLPIRRAAEIINEAARALEHAHEHGVLHRDIKPGNIILDSAGRPHLTDFGLAKLVESESTVTQTRELLGTPSYVSPEMARGASSEVGAATDVYGLGAVLYQLLTGKPPFAGGTTLETIRQVIETEPRRPSLWNPKVDRDLEVICLKCLEKDPARRYASAAALADDLERWLRHEPIAARPGSVAYRARKWIRRNARPVTVGGIAVLATALVIVSVKYAATPAPLPHSIAVLFRPADADAKYLTTEFTRNVIQAIGHLPGVKVAPRSAVLKWETDSTPAQEAAKALGVPVILSGTFKQTGDAFELRAELIETASGAKLWSNTFHEHLAAGALLQTQLARVVATRLGIQLTEKNRAELRRPLTANPEAWLHYLHARQHLDTFSEAKLLQAIGELEQAIALDPEFAQAYAGLAEAHLDLGVAFRDPALHLAKAKRYVREALKRDETLVEALIADGAVKYFYDWDWTGADRAVKQAVLLDPSALENHACYLHSLETVGQTDEALRMVRQASVLHPSSIAIQSELGCSAYYAGQLDAAAGFWAHALKTDPENPYLYWGMGRTLAQQGKYADAAKVLEAGQRKSDGDSTIILSELAFVRGREQRTADALSLIEQLRVRTKAEYVDPYLFAMAYAGLGDSTEVFRHLDLAVKGRSTWIPSLPVDPKFTALQRDPRFQQLLVLLKLPAKPVN
jgi:TolB-like protein/Tfp pilus assembly protein PilF/predicted Ser/Thr protein kinase